MLDRVLTNTPKEAKWVFRTKAPAGTDLVKAIATIDSIPIVSPGSLKSEGPVQVVTESESKVAKDICTALKPVDPKRWAEAQKEILIKE